MVIDLLRPVLRCRGVPNRSVSVCTKNDMNTRLNGPRIIVVGAGMSGILVGIKLLESGHTNFAIYEKADELGGTWRDNRYPGLSCDVPSHHYVYSFEPNSEWTSLFSGGPEILNYFKNAATKYHVREHIRFGSEVVAARFENGLWNVRIAGGELDQGSVLIAATGVLHHPKFPDIPGLSEFDGKQFHSARWDDTVDLSAKRVGIIGTGSTAVQIVPAIVNKVSKLTLFQRTAQWILPYPNKDYSEEERQTFRDDPGLMRAEYAKWEGQFNHTFARAVIGDEYEMQRIANRCKENLETNVTDPDLRSQLTPDYKVACKRLILSDQFYPAIQRKNAQLETTPISRVEHAGVVTKDGRLHELDVMVLATGFDGHRYARDIDISGTDGGTLNDAWGDSIWAHRGVAMPGFPNFYMLIGPHSPIGNFSLILIAEMQLNYLLQLIEPILTGESASVVPKRSATEAFNRSLRDAMKKTVWVSGCDSWYLDGEGNPITWPWSFEQFASDMKAPDLGEYVFDPGLGHI